MPNEGMRHREGEREREREREALTLHDQSTLHSPLAFHSHANPTDENVDYEGLLCQMRRSELHFSTITTITTRQASPKGQRDFCTGEEEVVDKVVLCSVLRMHSVTNQCGENWLPRCLTAQWHPQSLLSLSILILILWSSSANCHSFACPPNARTHTHTNRPRLIKRRWKSSERWSRKSWWYCESWIMDCAPR